MDEVIIYVLPTGQRISHDPNRVSLIPSEGGRIHFKSAADGRVIGPYRVATSDIEFLISGTEVSGAIAEVELESIDGDDKGNE